MRMGGAGFSFTPTNHTLTFNLIRSTMGTPVLSGRMGWGQPGTIFSAGSGWNLEQWKGDAAVRHGNRRVTAP